MNNLIGTTNSQIIGNNNKVVVTPITKTEYVVIISAVQKIIGAINSAKYQIKSYLSEQPKYVEDIELSFAKDKNKINNAILSNGKELKEIDQKELVRLSEQLKKLYLNNTNEIYIIFDRMVLILNFYL